MRSVVGYENLAELPAVLSPIGAFLDKVPCVRTELAGGLRSGLPEHLPQGYGKIGRFRPS